MNTPRLAPTPAIVPESAVRRLPRVALWLFCLAYVLPGVLGREPWKGDEITALGQMLALAQGQSSWWQPTLWGHAPELDALLPYWVGAWAIQLKPAWLSAAMAVRIPYLLLSGLTLAATWYGCYYLALSPQAQPVAFAFGGEARPKDYARTIADAALLAMIATLGLSLLSHQIGVVLMQLACVSLAFYGVAALPYHPRYSLSALVIGLLGLALSGAPSFAVLMALGSGVLCVMDNQSTDTPTARLHAFALVCMGLLVALIATQLEVWQWRLQALPNRWVEWRSMIRLLIWFTWPVWPLAAWTVWRWRRHWWSIRWSRHLILPLWFALLVAGTALATPAPERTLLLALPALACLAAFALPTLRRSVTAFIDWFTLIFFTGCAFVIWVIWLAMQTGWPAQPSANVARLAPGFVPEMNAFALLVAVLATLAWAALVQWRVGRHRHPLWKSLVLPAGGAALSWLLLMTLWLPLLDYARSYAPWVRQVQSIMQAPPHACVLTYGLNLGQMTAFHYHGQLAVHPLVAPTRGHRDAPAKLGDHPACDWLLVDNDLRPELNDVVKPSQWERIRTVRRPSDNDEDLTIYRRRP